MLFLPIIAEVATEAALKAMPQEVRVSHIDASWLSLMVGGVTTAIAVAVLFLFIGWLLVKYGAVKIGVPALVAVVPPGEAGKECIHQFLISPETCSACASERLLSSQHANQITELFGKWNNVRESMTTMAVDIGVIKADVGNINKGLAVEFVGVHL